MTPQKRQDAPTAATDDDDADQPTEDDFNPDDTDADTDEDFDLNDMSRLR
jgi:hypothetical protein